MAYVYQALGTIQPGPTWSYWQIREQQRQPIVMLPSAFSFPIYKKVTNGKIKSRMAQKSYYTRSY